jgi:hypothetical protein
MTDAVAKPKTETTAALRPWPRQRDRMNTIAGPGVRLSAKAEIMNSAVVCELGIIETLRRSELSLCHGTPDDHA